MPYIKRLNQSANVNISNMSKWIKCSDRLPAIDGYYLVFCKDENTIAICPFEENKWNLFLYWDDHGYKVELTEEQSDITHWQHIPSKPI